MEQAQHRLTVNARGQGLHEVTGEIAAWLSGQPIRDGLLTVFVRHTSASLLIQENADQDVQRDIESFFAKLVPEDPRLYRHNSEGPDDMPAHIKGALTQTQLSIPVGAGRMLLGTWQGIYLFEHRRAPHRREVVLHLIGQ
ncbi:MAG: secondary thiamine-phosphate synthase enzyme YjbQ [Rhodospirillales bacterium]|nr:secondary thiamine-phosphate synthase enzyme YjbQ [Rhodospirillales bacterium]MDH3918563.1 secondary thiamine-phosphate synthase enzyme YjbQ [Rhodospirillales bacterium]